MFLDCDSCKLERQLQFYTCLGRGLGCCEDGEGGPLAHVLYFSSAQSVYVQNQCKMCTKMILCFLWW